MLTSLPAQFTENVYQTIVQHIFVHEDESAIHQLIAALGAFSNDLHEEIPVYAHGYWEKDHQLWLDVQKADWEDVILDASFKKRLQDDITGFFKSEQVYRDLAIPWKVLYLSCQISLITCANKPCIAWDDLPRTAWQWQDHQSQGYHEGKQTSLPLR